MSELSHTCYRSADIDRSVEFYQELGPFDVIAREQAVAVLGKGVSGFKVGPMPDYTHYWQIKKA